MSHLYAPKGASSGPNDELAELRHRAKVLESALREKERDCGTLRNQLSNERTRFAELRQLSEQQAQEIAALKATEVGHGRLLLGEPISQDQTHGHPRPDSWVLKNKPPGTTHQHPAAAAPSITGGALVRQPSCHGESLDVGAECVSLFRLARQWAVKYTSKPRLGEEMTDEFEELLVRACIKTAVKDVLIDQATRSEAVVRYLVETLVERTWRVELLKGFESPRRARVELDAAAEELRLATKARPEDKPTRAQKAALVTAQSEAVLAMISQPDFAAFAEGKATELSAHCLNALGVLARPKGDLITDFNWLVRQFIRMGMKTLSISRTVRVDFPWSGPQVFSPETQVNCDPVIEGAPNDLRVEGWRIKMGILPAVTVSDFYAESIVPKMVHKAEVLLWKWGEKKETEVREMRDRRERRERKRTEW